MSEQVKAQPLPRRSKRVLVVDDSPLVLVTVRHLLESVGLEVEVAESPFDFEPTQGLEPDLILMDVNMPQFYGDDMVSFFKEELGLRMPIFLHSTLSDEQLEVRRASCGAEGFVGKAHGPMKLLETVQRALGWREPI